MNGEQSAKSVADEKDELKNKIMKLQEEKAEMATKLLAKTEENCELKLKMKEMEAKIEKSKGSKEKPVTNLCVRQNVRQNRYKIYVNTMMGKTFKLNDCSLLNTVEDIKAKVQDVEGTPPDHQSLIFNGKQLEDSHTLADYNIQEGSTLQMILRIRGC